MDLSSTSPSKRTTGNSKHGQCKKQMSRLLKHRKERAFLGFIREAKGLEQSDMVRTGVLQSDLESHLSSLNLLAPIKEVLYEFHNAFLVDLPIGLPPNRKGHGCKIDLEDDVPQFIDHCIS